MQFDNATNLDRKSGYVGRKNGRSPTIVFYVVLALATLSAECRIQPLPGAPSFALFAKGGIPDTEGIRGERRIPPLPVVRHQRRAIRQ